MSLQTPLTDETDNSLPELPIAPLSLSDACDRYNLDIKEFRRWLRKKRVETSTSFVERDRAMIQPEQLVSFLAERSNTSQSPDAELVFDQVYTSTQVAKILNSAVRTVSEWMREGKLPSIPSPESHSNWRVIPREIFHEYLRDNGMLPVLENAQALSKAEAAQALGRNDSRVPLRLLDRKKLDGFILPGGTARIWNRSIERYQGRETVLIHGQDQQRTELIAHEASMNIDAIEGTTVECTVSESAADMLARAVSHNVTGILLLEPAQTQEITQEVRQRMTDIGFPPPLFARMREANVTPGYIERRPSDDAGADMSYSVHQISPLTTVRVLNDILKKHLPRPQFRRRRKAA